MDHMYLHSSVPIWQLKFFTEFKLKNPEAPMSLIKFQRLKPWFVRRLKYSNTCTYQYHAKFNELRFGLNIMWTIGHPWLVCLFLWKCVQTWIELCVKRAFLYCPSTTIQYIDLTMDLNTLLQRWNHWVP